MKKVTLLVLSLVSLTIATAKEKKLTINDIEPKLAGKLVGQNVEFKKVKYMVVGKESYDDFFFTSAKLNGLGKLSRAMTKASTKQLKKYAMSKAADETMKENIKELIGESEPDKLSTEQSFAIMKMSKKRKQLTKDELNYFKNTIIALLIVTESLKNGVGEVGQLTKDGKKLIKGIKKAKLKLKQIIPTTKGLNSSIKNLTKFGKNTPKVLEEIAVLVKGFQMLSSA